MWRLVATYKSTSFSQTVRYDAKNACRQQNVDIRLRAHFNNNLTCIMETRWKKQRTENHNRRREKNHWHSKDEDVRSEFMKKQKKMQFNAIKVLK